MSALSSRRAELSETPAADLALVGDRNEMRRLLIAYESAMRSVFQLEEQVAPAASIEAASLQALASADAYSMVVQRIARAPAATTVGWIVKVEALCAALVDGLHPPEHELLRCLGRSIQSDIERLEKDAQWRSVSSAASSCA